MEGWESRSRSTEGGWVGAARSDKKLPPRRVSGGENKSEENSELKIQPRSILGEDGGY